MELVTFETAMSETPIEIATIWFITVLIIYIAMLTIITRQ